MGGADHEDDYSKGVKERASGFKNVVLTGRLTGLPLKEFYTHAGLFVLPSYYEGLPIAPGTRLKNKEEKLRQIKHIEQNIFFWKKEALIVFCLLFGKNEQDNVTHDEKRVLKILSDEYDGLTEIEIERNIKNKQFEVIPYEQGKKTF